ncbi:MAG: hypothetical protein AAFW00_19290 [Bacteroidota bacterium]
MAQALTNQEEIRNIFLPDFLRNEPFDPQNAFFSIVTISIFDPSYESTSLAYLLMVFWSQWSIYFPQYLVTCEI